VYLVSLGDELKKWVVMPMDIEEAGCQAVSNFSLGERIVGN
jgi:hypothetical protein